MTEESLQVPLAMRWPEQIKAGSKSQSFVTNMAKYGTKNEHRLRIDQV